VALLEYINYVPHRAVVLEQGVEWVLNACARTLSGLPQIFWNDGTPWAEANHWALENAHFGAVKLETVQNLMGHLHKYAKWLEEEQVDWRHFPMRKSDRVLVRYRGALIVDRNDGRISPSTATARMRAVIQFYRHCSAHNFVSREAPKWNDKQVVVHFYDSCGFERTTQRLSTDISIPNRARPGLRLEDGLLPITAEHQRQLLLFTKTNASYELHLMLMIGFYTGARLGTITSLRIETLEEATPGLLVPDMWNIAIGPGTRVSTKFDVKGTLLIPEQIMRELRLYAYSTRRIKREEMAAKDDKSLLFLTRFSKPYKSTAVSREMVDLRRSATKTGLKFMDKFHFHQTRATFGTWLMSIALKVTTVKEALIFVRQAMLHKHESTTMRYIHFMEQTKAKVEVANAFSEAFMGLADRVGDGKRP
jgi:integrase